jgi:cytochrome c553
MKRISASLWVLSLATIAFADEQPPSAEGLQFFEAKIRPVLIENCYQCHSSEGKQGIRGGLSVDHRDGLVAGGESGPAIVPRKLAESVLWDAINHGDLQMPPNRKLPMNVIEDFRQWIEMGAPDPRTGTGIVVHSRVTEEDIDNGRDFWAFKRPSIVPPTLGNESLQDWPKSEIDRYIAARYAKEGLAPAADAEPAVIARRLYFDLIGLPPTVAQLDKFVAASKSNAILAISNTVNELLELPQFGERWGRHWLDVARYAESTGKEIDMTFPNAWRYRDYVIDAFYHDKPYDKFIREQIAGDLLPAENDRQWGEHLIATGFLALGPKALTEQNPRQFRADLIDEQIDTTTRVVLGISVACARCHDHKFDPIPQEDYYALAGIFQSSETYYGGVRNQRNRQPSNLLVLPFDDPNPIDKPMSRGEIAELKKSISQREKEYEEARRALRQGTPSKSDPRRDFLSANVLDQMVATLTAKLHSVDETGKPLTCCMGVQALDRPRNARLLVRGEIDQMAQEIPRGFVKVISEPGASIPTNVNGRMELANWLSSRDNPLTARVMANRVWQHLLGQALVRETDNFGASGPGPTHPELLDYLAIKFMDHGWSVKALIREIANSRVYRLSSQHDQNRFEKDPDNFLLARAHVRRLDAEAIRDAILVVSGQIDLQRPKGSMIAEFGSTVLGPNGPLLPPPGTPGMGDRRAMEAIASLRSRASGGNPLDAANYYRSVYLPIARNSLPRALDVFDFAEPSIIVGERETSHTADQALFMLNNPFVIEQSDALARKLLREHSQQPMSAAFLHIYGRQPSTTELRAAGEFLRTAVAEPSSASKEQRSFRALSRLCQALFAAAEFRFLK